MRLTARLIEFYTAQNYFSISERERARLQKKLKENVCFSAAKLPRRLAARINIEINDGWISKFCGSLVLKSAPPVHLLEGNLWRWGDHLHASHIYNPLTTRAWQKGYFFQNGFRVQLNELKCH